MTNTFFTTLEFTFDDEDAPYFEFPAEVEYEYYAGEPAVMWGDNCHPETPEELSVCSVYVAGKEIYQDLPDSIKSVLEIEAWDHLNDEKAAWEEAKAEYQREAAEERKRNAGF